MSNQIIPVNSAPGQQFNVSVSINGGVSTFFLAIVFNEIAGYWVLSLSDASQNLLLSDVPLLTGLDLFQQYQYLAVGSLYVVNASGVSIDSPNATDLGSDFILVWGDNTQPSVPA